jgi:hypothetical protein
LSIRVHSPSETNRPNIVWPPSGFERSRTAGGFAGSVHSANATLLLRPFEMGDQGTPDLSADVAVAFVGELSDCGGELRFDPGADRDQPVR